MSFVPVVLCFSPTWVPPRVPRFLPPGILVVMVFSFTASHPFIIESGNSFGVSYIAGRNAIISSFSLLFVHWNVRITRARYYIEINYRACCPHGKYRKQKSLQRDENTPITIEACGVAHSKDFFFFCKHCVTRIMYTLDRSRSSSDLRLHTYSIRK